MVDHVPSITTNNTRLETLRKGGKEDSINGVRIPTAALMLPATEEPLHWVKSKSASKHQLLPAILVSWSSHAHVSWEEGVATPYSSCGHPYGSVIMSFFVFASSFFQRDPYS